MKGLIKALILTSLVLNSQQNLAQITNMEDCTEPGERELLQDQLLTRAEIIALMDKDFEAKVSQQDKCAGSLSGAAGNGSGGANSAGSGGGGTGSNSDNSTNLTSAPNQLTQGEQSTSLDNDLSTTSTVLNSGNASSSPGGSTTLRNNGRREQELLDADADRETIEQLKVLAEMPENASIKEELLQQIKELERVAN